MNSNENHFKKGRVQIGMLQVKTANDSKQRVHLFLEARDSFSTGSHEPMPILAGTPIFYQQMST